ncbi:hypothetical protein AVEN_97150-1 [Araneus ventricosus]|uniref:Uncharacterized protein n=1 Tax=Araneus ventricosus TaxID=182803 RepID=A0A4Y2DGD9_ARAVE|nr:hypothetical protein AVEN_97150-1 [Araneus ventricosus]
MWISRAGIGGDSGVVTRRSRSMDQGSRVGVGPWTGGAGPGEAMNQEDRWWGPGGEGPTTSEVRFSAPRRTWRQDQVELESWSEGVPGGPGGGDQAGQEGRPGAGGPW